MEWRSAFFFVVACLTQGLRTPVSSKDGNAMAMSTAAGSMSDLDQNGERPPASINGSEVLPKNDRIGKGESVAICAIAKEEEKYIVEWLDYYSGIGTDMIYLYDNSKNNTLAPLNKRPGVTVIHYPRHPVQFSAYSKCLANRQQHHTWMGIVDCDEFVVLYKHKTLKDMLREHLKSGALGLNWVIFGTSNEKEYRPKPVSLRFQLRMPGFDPRVKSFFRSGDVYEYNHPHYPTKLRKGTHQHDTSGYVFSGPFNGGCEGFRRVDRVIIQQHPGNFTPGKLEHFPHALEDAYNIGSEMELYLDQDKVDDQQLVAVDQTRPRHHHQHHHHKPPKKQSMACNSKNHTNVAVVHHFRYKSIEEYKRKRCYRHNADSNVDWCSVSREVVNGMFVGKWRNSDVWDTLKRVMPKYEVCEDPKEGDKCAEISKF